MNLFTMFFGATIIAAMFRLAVPVLFVSIGGCFGHKANVLNIGLESFLAISAFFSMCGSYWAEDPWMGLLLGMVSGVLASVVFAIFVLWFNSNPMVIGIAMNLAAWGITNFLLQVIFDKRSIFVDPRIKSFQQIEIPILKDIPYLGKILSGQNILVYLSLAGVITAYILMYKTPFGLRIRGVGINQVAAQSLGVSANRYKWAAILLGGVFGGMGGAFLTIGGSSMFTEKISAGNGFLALAAIMVGDGNPFKTALACMVFGYVSALSVTLQSIRMPSQVVLCMPYAITVLILIASAVAKKLKQKKNVAKI